MSSPKAATPPLVKANSSTKVKSSPSKTKPKLAKAPSSKGAAANPAAAKVVAKKPNPKVASAGGIVKTAFFVAAATDEKNLPAPLYAEVAFAGKSNVGKSSLINKLVNQRKLARSSSTPGCTRGLNLFRMELLVGEERTEAILDFVDLPGYGFAKRSKMEKRTWGKMIETFLENRVGLRAVLVLLDVRRGLQDDDLELFEYLAHINRPAICVLTKCDKLSRNESMKAVFEVKKQFAESLAVKGIDLSRTPILPASAETGEGVDDVMKSILRSSSVGARTAS